MAEDWGQAAKEILDDFTEDGTLFSFYRIIQGQYDPLEGAYGESTRQDFVVPGFYQSLNTAVTFQEGFSGHSIERGDLLLNLANNFIYKPTSGDFILIDGVTWIVQNVSVSQPAGVALTYQVSIRKG